MKWILGLLALAMSATGCRPQRPVQYGTGFAMVAGGAGYSYKVWLNGEPVTWGHAQNTFVLHDFPLQTGSNHLTVEMEITSPETAPPTALNLIVLISDISGREPTKDGDWKRKDGFIQFGPFSEDGYGWNWAFELRAAVQRDSKDFDLLPGDKESLKRRAQLLAFEFAERLRKGDEAEWMRIWGPGAQEQFRKRTQALASGGFGEARSVMTPSEVLVDFGTKLILVHAREGALVQFFDEGNSPKYGYADFLFARSGERWSILGADRRWWTLPNDLQNL